MQITTVTPLFWFSYVSASEDDSQPASDAGATTDGEAPTPLPDSPPRSRVKGSRSPRSLSISLPVSSQGAVKGPKSPSTPKRIFPGRPAKKRGRQSLRGCRSESDNEPPSKYSLASGDEGRQEKSIQVCYRITVFLLAPLAHNRSMDIKE